MTLTPREAAQKRADAQKLPVMMQVGKAGVGEATAAELLRHLKSRKLVKVRLLPASTAGSTSEEQARQLAEATRSDLVEVRGSTAVFWRG
jgi:RNA-binding protein